MSSNALILYELYVQRFSVSLWHILGYVGGRVLLAGFKSWPSYKLSSWCFVSHVVWFINVCPPLGGRLTGCPACQHLFVDVKDPTVSFLISRRYIASTLNKFQIPALTYMGHLYEQYSHAPSKWCYPQPCAPYKRGRKRRKRYSALSRLQPQLQLCGWFLMSSGQLVMAVKWGSL